AMQIAGSHYDQDLWFRKTNNNPAQPWSKILAVSGTNSSLGWLTNGNSNTSSATNFIGTTDAQDFVFKTNNTENMRITNGGYVGIGSATPAQKLSVEGGNIQVGELIPAIGVGRDLIFGDQFSNSDAIHFVRENIGLNLSKLTLVLGDDYGATIANDQFNIEATNSPIPVLSVHTGTISVGVGTNAPAYRLHVLDGHAASTSSDGLASALLSPDGCVELFRNRVSTPNGKAYIDFKDNASDDLDFRIEQYNPLGSVANQVLNYYSPLSPRTLSMRNDNGFIGMGLNFDLHSAETRLHIVEDNMAQGITNDLLLLDHYHNNADWTPILQRNARGTEAAPANLQTNDALGGLLMIGRAGGVNSIMSYINSNYSGNGSTVSSNLFFGTSALNRVMIDQLGNVGIGTMSPAQRLTIEGGDVQIGEIMPVTGVGRRLMFTDIGNSTDAMFFQRENIVLDASNLNLYIGDNQGSGPTVSDKFNVMTTNNAMPIFTVDAGTYSVGIGNTDPLATLDLRGPVKYAFAAGTGAGSDGPSRAIIPAADGGSRMNDWPNGWGGGLSTWDIVGSSAFFFNYIIRSDERLKKDIVTMNTNITESYMQLRPVTYLLKKQTPETEGLHYGFIAQEVAKLFPSIVTKDSGLEGATIGMNYQALIAPTVHVVQEQQNTITNLQTQLQELSRKLDEQNKLLQLLMQDRK
ncbi:MAG: tail fiber domain-containing protein, partial [Bacteroidia bacterium]|nr:tail fiber domain-containing protein [Bacteroidia bacterium]